MRVGVAPAAAARCRRAAAPPPLRRAPARPNPRRRRRCAVVAPPPPPETGRSKCRRPACNRCCARPLAHCGSPNPAAANHHGAARRGCLAGASAGAPPADARHARPVLVIVKMPGPPVSRRRRTRGSCRRARERPRRPIAVIWVSWVIRRSKPVPFDLHVGLGGRISPVAPTVGIPPAAISAAAASSGPSPAAPPCGALAASASGSRRDRRGSWHRLKRDAEQLVGRAVQRRHRGRPTRPAARIRLPSPVHSRRSL